MIARSLASALALVLVAALPAGAAGGPTVFVQDNAFVRVIQRPHVEIRAGTTVTWTWRAQQSHGVSGTGPERFGTPVRTRGSFRHRFTRAGTYRVICPLHAPGMKMTVVVRR